MDNTIALAALHSAGFTHKDLKKIFEKSDSYTKVLTNFLDRKWPETPWMTQERRAKILEKLSNIDLIKLGETIRVNDIHIITIKSEEYPEKLRTIKQAPYMLYVRGILSTKSLMLGIVWSRRNTNYGKKVLEEIIPPIVHIGWGIVSGGAYGIDAISHEVTLVHDGYTISVFGCGVDILYPSRNTGLFNTILAKWWALVSIFPIGTLPEPYCFPIRNEVVAALSDGIVIPEAGLKSGTLITAALALEHGRDVFAIPGDIFRETSAGTNMLIATGQAKCIQGADGILEEYFPNMTQSSISLIEEIDFESEEQKHLYHAIMEWYDTPDSIWQNTEYTIDIITMNLSLLEMNGHIRLAPWGRYETL
jgi:DNA processing protein